MPSLKILLPVILSLATATMAGNSDDCPHNWFSNRYEDRRCCYGHMMIEDTTAYCCVYEVLGYEDPATMTSTSETTSASTDSYYNWSGADYCFTKIPFKASDYSARVSSASDAIEASKSALATASASAEGSESSTNAAMPVATAQGMVLGGAALAAAFFCVM
ncbi:uncharacterized protein KD926_002098 [Aspergillus affinis]|uniref:uncharacterized protein n=1 Tax=Aspergillus affinis TaxID=1070780 RepID=UPI0022FE25C2|nr:uncharacterized protein KD926_002098 [Aspergillus affinis]KAI9036280.1 hypothetical protein KD926_002098 [Aspergillus affinis]